MLHPSHRKLRMPTRPRGARDRQGQALVEYAMLTALVAVSLIVMVVTLRNSVGRTYDNATGRVDQAAGCGYVVTGDCTAGAPPSGVGAGSGDGTPSGTPGGHGQGNNGNGQGNGGGNGSNGQGGGVGNTGGGGSGNANSGGGGNGSGGPRK